MTRASLVSPAFVRLRQYSAAARMGAKVPRRCTRMTASHSSAVMLTIMRSRRIPALLTTTSRPPKVSTAVSMSRLAPSTSATSSPLATALAPMARISSTTWPAGPADRPLPSTSAPRSLTTTLAPWRANSMAWARPMPRPAPVITTTRPSQMPGTRRLLQVVQVVRLVQLVRLFDRSAGVAGRPHTFFGSSAKGVVRSLFGSLGRPSTRSPMTFLWIWSVPP